MRVLVVEDDLVIADLLARSLRDHHYAVDIAEDGALGWECAESAAYDLILLDVDLPRLDGISLCQRLRDRNCTTPILLMTARDATAQRIRGLDAGADDYLVKPINLDELQARVRALLRRGTVTANSVLEVGLLRLDPRACQATYAARVLPLTPKEYSLLELFLRHPARVFSCGDVIEHLWTFDDPPQEDSVKSHIKGLRQKLKAVGAVDWIDNVYGLGYRLGEKVAKEPRSHERPLPSPNLHETITPSSSDSSEPPLYNQAVDRLWDQYRGLMTERLTVLRQVVQAVESRTLSLEIQQSTERAAHKLAGVLGMFGRDEGTQIARQLERILSTEQTLNPHQHAEVCALVQRLRESLDLDLAESEHNPAVPVSTSVTVQPTVSAALRSWQVLAVDDDPIILATLKQLLEPWGMHVTGIENPLHFWTVLPMVNPDLMILDVEMPQLNGIALCQAIRANPAWQSLPIVFLTAHQDSATVQQIFAAGADDYVIKPMVGQELISRITQRLERIRLLQALSTKDSITGLANQFNSSQAIENLLARTSSGYLAIAHLPELRQINVQHGHSVGNHVLKHCGQALQSVFYNREILSYWGNGEFVISAGQGSIANFQQQLLDVIEPLRQHYFLVPDHNRIQIRCDLAIVEYPADGSTLRSLYQTASLRLESQR
jgi:diguanylate cyclase (GGDEF)-like protein